MIRGSEHDTPTVVELGSMVVIQPFSLIPILRIWDWLIPFFSAASLISIWYFSAWIENPPLRINLYSASLLPLILVRPLEIIAGWSIRRIWPLRACKSSLSCAPVLTTNGFFGQVIIQALRVNNCQRFLQNTT